MTLQRMERICRLCGKRYSYNPDVGKIFCDRCGKKRRIRFWKYRYARKGVFRKCIKD